MIVCRYPDISTEIYVIAVLCCEKLANSKFYAVVGVTFFVDAVLHRYCKFSPSFSMPFYIAVSFRVASACGLRATWPQLTSLGVIALVVACYGSCGR